MPTTASIRDAYAMYRLNTDDDREELTVEQCQERLTTYRGDFDRWADENGVESVPDEIAYLPVEVGPRG